MLKSSHRFVLAIGGIVLALSLTMVQDRAIAGLAVGFCVWQLGLALLIVERRAGDDGVADDKLLQGLAGDQRR